MRIEMRERKYKAWDKKKKEWLHDFRIHPDGSVMVAEKSRGRFWKYELSTRKAKNIVLIEYTGLKDKNGKEIYDGDILETHYFDPRDVLGMYDLVGEVIFDKRSARFCVRRKNKGDEICPETHFGFGIDIIPNRKYTKVIGNIYENERLLKEKA